MGDLSVLGDVAPSRLTMVDDFTLDLTSSGTSFTMSSLPQGLYSRVRFEAEHPALDGTWHGAPLHFAFESEQTIDLRADGVDVAGHDGEFVVGVDAGSWFSGNVLDGIAPDSNGEIILDATHNASVAATVASRVPASFTLQDASTVQ